MKSKIKVTWLGYQEQSGGVFFLLVNEVISHTTVTYDPQKHIIIRHSGKGINPLKT